MTSITTFLMFQGNVEAAMNYYVSLFDDAEILHISRYCPNEDGVEGSVKQASFFLNSQKILCIDSNVQYPFTFTPSFSLFITCDAEQEIESLFVKLSEHGNILMPLENYDFSKKFGWTVDQFGVAWQLTYD